MGFVEKNAVHISAHELCTKQQVQTILDGTRLELEGRADKINGVVAEVCSKLDEQEARLTMISSQIDGRIENTNASVSEVRCALTALVQDFKAIQQGMGHIAGAGVKDLALGQEVLDAISSLEQLDQERQDELRYDLAASAKVNNDNAVTIASLIGDNSNRAPELRGTSPADSNSIHSMPCQWQAMLQDQITSFDRQHRLVQQEQDQSIAKVQEVVATAAKQADEAIGAAQLSLELAREGEEVFSRKMSKATSELRAELQQAITLRASQNGCIEEAVKDLRAKICEVNETAQQNKGELHEQETKFNCMINPLKSELEQLHVLQQEVKELREEALQASQQASTEAQKVRKALESQCTKLETGLCQLSDRLEEQMSQSTAQSTAAATELENIKKQCCEEVRSQVAEQCGELHKFAVQLREVALQEVRSVLKVLEEEKKQKAL